MLQAAKAHLLPKRASNSSQSSCELKLNEIRHKTSEKIEKMNHTDNLDRQNLKCCEYIFNNQKN